MIRIGLVACGMFLSGCMQLPRSDAVFVRQLSSVEALALANAGRLTFLDVRSEDERLSGVVPDAKVALFGPRDPALWMLRKASTSEVNRFVAEVNESLPDKRTAIGVFCNVGARSYVAAGVLTQNGYRDVVTVADGYLGNRQGEGLEAQLLSKR